jgi:8-oxo-dGTP pyrophosphatase MutT (NUDIX family)
MISKLATISPSMGGGQENYCNNCGKGGHMFHQCKIPITSIGVIAFRVVDNEPQYLLIRRKDSLGFIDFMRGKYSVHNKYYILNMLKQMTIDEKRILRLGDFDELWKHVWGHGALSNQYKNEENVSREKYNMLYDGIYVKNAFYNLNDLIDESDRVSSWEETEWGFPKGRRNYQESDFDCALREFSEETGYSSRVLKNVQNLVPYEEIFTGSNYKSYKHKYYLMYMRYADTLEMNNYQKTEVSKMEWKSYDECIASMREYNLEKKRIISNVHNCIKSYSIYTTEIN